MIVNETATRSRALDEHSRAKMRRQGLADSGADAAKEGRSTRHVSGTDGCLNGRGVKKYLEGRQKGNTSWQVWRDGGYGGVAE